MSKTMETIKELASLALLTNRLSDIQIKNLEMFPFVFFDGVLEAKIDYDLSNNVGVETEEDLKNIDINYKFTPDTKNLKVSYYLTIDNNILNSHMNKRFEAIKTAIRQIFWKETNIEVYINNKLSYSSKQ